MPNYNGAGYNYLFQERFVNQPRQSFSSRVDYHPTDKDTVSVTFKNWGADISGIHVAAAASKWGLAYMTYEFAAYQSTNNWTRVITPHLVNEFFVGGLHDKENSPPVGSDCTTNGCGQYNPLKRQYRGALQQLGQLRAASQLWRDSNQLQRRDTFKAGFFFEHSRFGRTVLRQRRFRPKLARSHQHRLRLCERVRWLGRGPDNTLHNIMAVYIQDTWKVRRNLTIDIGLRVYRDRWPLQVGWSGVDIRRLAVRSNLGRKSSGVVLSGAQTAARASR